MWKQQNMLKISLLFIKIQTLRVNNSRILTIKIAKFSGYYVYMNLNIWEDFQILHQCTFKVLLLVVFSVEFNFWSKTRVFQTSYLIFLISLFFSEYFFQGFFRIEAQFIYLTPICLLLALMAQKRSLVAVRNTLQYTATIH